MRRLPVGALAVAAGALVISATACARTPAEPVSAPPAPAAPATPAAPAVATSEDVLLGSGRDRTASHTASDWVTYADHVLVVTVVSEVRHKPVQAEVERGEGMVARTVKMRVDKVLWSAPDAAQPAPAALSWSAAGWVFNNNEGTPRTVKFALRNSSRMETGHTYVLAVLWIDDPCYADPKQGRWDALGSGGTIPFDRGVLGAGEVEGRVYTLDKARTKWQAKEAVSPSLRGQMTGSSIESLVAALKSASPRPEQGYGPSECDLSDR